MGRVFAKGKRRKGNVDCDFVIYLSFMDNGGV